MSLSTEFRSPFRLFDWAVVSVARRNALVIAALTLVSVVYQTRWGTVPDVSWLITACERILSGDLLYRDIIDSNPPFNFWLYLPPVMAAYWTGVTPEALVCVWTYAAALAGLVLAGIVVCRAGFAEAPALLRMAPWFYAMLVLFPGNAFSQREHFGAMLFLPLLALHAWRARKTSDGPTAGLAAITGLSASILLLVKPYFAAVVLASAMVAVIRKRSLRPLLMLEHVVIGVVCLAYFGATALLYPDYMRNVVPLALDLYAPMRAYWPTIVQYGPSLAIMGVLVWRLWPSGQWPELATVSLVAAVTALALFVYQGKGWPYHAYPGVLFLVVTLLCLFANRRTASTSASWRIGKAPLFALAGLAVLFLALPFFVTQKPPGDFVASIRAAADKPTVAMIGTDISVGHPLARLVGGRYVGTYPFDWIGPFALLRSLQAADAGDQPTAARYGAIASGYAAAERAELSRLKPDLILVDAEDGFWIPQLMARYHFVDALADYEILAENAAIRVYRRKP